MTLIPPSVRATRNRAFGVFVLLSLLATLLVFRGGLPALHEDRFEALLLLQMLVIWPCVYFVTVFAATRRMLPLLGYLTLGMLFGKLALPPAARHIWRYVDDLRWVIAAALVAVETSVIIILLRSLRRLSRADAPEEVITGTVRHYLGDKLSARLLAAELGMWFYALCSGSRHELKFPGDHFFTVFRHQGNAATQKGFLILIGVEIPVVHGLLSLWSLKAALIVTALSVYGWLWLLAEYRATLLRPVSIDRHTLFLRYGILGNEAIPLEAIRSARPWTLPMGRRRGLLRHTAGGTPNILLELKPGTPIDTLFGTRAFDTILLAVDEPGRFLSVLDESIAPKGASRVAGKYAVHGTIHR